jgi:hypothetical protein
MDTFQENKANQSKRNNKQGCLGLLRKECNVLFIKHAVGTRTLQCDFLFASSKAFPHLTCSSCPHLPKMLALLVLSTHVCMVPDPYQHDTSYRTTKQSCAARKRLQRFREHCCQWSSLLNCSKSRTKVTLSLQIWSSAVWKNVTLLILHSTFTVQIREMRSENGFLDPASNGPYCCPSRIVFWCDRPWESTMGPWGWPRFWTWVAPPNHFRRASSWAHHTLVLSESGPNCVVDHHVSYPKGSSPIFRQIPISESYSWNVASHFGFQTDSMEVEPANVASPPIKFHQTLGYSYPLDTLCAQVLAAWESLKKW